VYKKAFRGGWDEKEPTFFTVACGILTVQQTFFHGDNLFPGQIVNSDFTVACRGPSKRDATNYAFRSAKLV
jgi:hypothetical protein